MTFEERAVTLAWGISRPLALLGLVASIVLVLAGKLWVSALGGVSAVSLGCVCGLYYLMCSRLRQDGMGRGQSMVLAVLFANVFAQTYEVVYHFTFPVYFNYFSPPFFSGADVRFAALEAVVMMPVFLVRRHLRFGRLSALLLLLFAGIWSVWILYGFPQYFAVGTFYPRVLSSADPYHLSLLLNFGSKTVLALLFGSLVHRS